MYILLALVVFVPLLFRLVLPVAVTPEVDHFYNTIQKLPTHNKIAVVSIVWASGTIAENGPQTEAVMKHFFKRNIPFAIIAWDQQGSTLALKIAQDTSRSMGKEYGRDWVHLGYRPAYISQFVRAMAKNIPATFEKDINGTPMSKIPMMKGIKNAKNISAVIEVTPSGTLESWIAFLGEPYHIPIGYCPTAVMVPEGYNYLDAGQIFGMLPGMIGAAEYESLLGYEGDGLRNASALSTSHMLIILLIVLGNLGYLAAKQREAA